MNFRSTIWLSAAFLVLLLAAAIGAPWLTPYAAEGAGAPHLAHKLLSPSWAHPFGTDEMGRDLLARIFYGARTSLALAALVIGGSVTLGTSAMMGPSCICSRHCRMIFTLS